MRSMNRVVSRMLVPTILAGTLAAVFPASPATAVDGPQGVDVSSHQGSVNYSSVKSSGQDFVFVRSGIGNHTEDDTFIGNYDRAKSAGLLVGAYHVADADRTDGDAIREARWFVNRHGGRGGSDGELPSVLDLETNPNGMSPAELQAWVGNFLDELEERLGKRPIIYTYPAFWEGAMGNTGKFSGYPLWIAHYGVSSPRIPGGWNRHTFWQYTNDGSVPGVSGPVDRNRFNGTLAELRTMAGRSESGADLSVSGVTDPDGSLTIFARREGSLWTKNRQGDGTWAPWVNRGGNLASGPDAAVTAANYYHVVTRGENGKVHYKRQDATGWSEWHTTFSEFDTPYAPAIVSVDGNTLIALAVRASDKALMKRRYDANTGWEPTWAQLGNSDGYTSGPDAALRDGGKIDVVIRGPGGHVNHILRAADGTWNNPHPMGDLITAVGAAPAAASRLTGTVDLMARGPQGYIHRNTLRTDGTWTGWEHIVAIGQLNQGPDLVPNTGAGELQLLGRDTDGHIIRAVWNPGNGWTNPTHIPTN